MWNSANAKQFSCYAYIGFVISTRITTIKRECTGKTHMDFSACVLCILCVEISALQLTPTRPLSLRCISINILTNILLQESLTRMGSAEASSGLEERRKRRRDVIEPSLLHTSWKSWKRPSKTLITPTFTPEKCLAWKRICLKIGYRYNWGTSE